MQNAGPVQSVTGPGPEVPSRTEVARWEWRAFVPRGDSSVAHLALPGSLSAAERSREVYLLSTRSPANVKVRAGFVEVKALEVRNASGLERWRPTLRAELPVDAATLRRLFDAWRLPPPDLRRDWYSLGAIRREIVAPEAALRVIPLGKRRVRFSPDGCLGEFVEVNVGRSVWWSVAVEDADAKRVERAVRGLGLESLPTESYPAALKRIAGSLSHAGQVTQEVP